MTATVCILKRLGILILALIAYIILTYGFMAIYHQVFGTVGGNL